MTNRWKRRLRAWSFIALLTLFVGGIVLLPERDSIWLIGGAFLGVVVGIVEFYARNGE